MYQHILLAVALQKWEEFTPHALAARDAAVAMAKGSGAKLSALSVYDYTEVKEPSGIPQEMAVRYREDQMHRIDALMESKLKNFLAGAQGADIPITSVLVAGEPRQTIVATAERLEVGLLVIGAHSKRSIFDVVLGGTAAYVSRHAPCPVVMVKPASTRQGPATR